MSLILCERGLRISGASQISSRREAAGRPFPKHVHGFLRVRCEDCHTEKLVALTA